MALHKGNHILYPYLFIIGEKLRYRKLSHVMAALAATVKCM